MLEETDRTVFDSTDMATGPDRKAESGPSPTDSAETSESGQPPARSFADWIARGYLPG